MPPIGLVSKINLAYASDNCQLNLEIPAFYIAIVISLTIFNKRAGRQNPGDFPAFRN